jgi:hypothetical protein
MKYIIQKFFKFIVNNSFIKTPIAIEKYITALNISQIYEIIYVQLNAHKFRKLYYKLFNSQIL